MAANDVTLLEVHTTGAYQTYWEHWTAITGGEHYVLGSVADLPGAIYDLIEAQALYLSSLTIEVTTPGYETWLTSVSPAAYTDIMLPYDATFDVSITVPADATPGVHTIQLSAIGDGASYGEQYLTVIVPEPAGCVAGYVTADCPSEDTPLYGVHVDLYEIGSGALIASAVTDMTGYYEMCDIMTGDYNATIVTPLGYTATSEEIAVTVPGGDYAYASFDLNCVEGMGEPRTIGFWKHQVAVAISGRGNAQVDATDLCGYLDDVETHFNSNAVNQVIIYDAPDGATCEEKFLIAKDLLNLHGAQTMEARARQQLMALLLNVAAGYLHQTAVISDDGAIVSQAITFCDNVIDDPFGDYELAKDIADMINNNMMVPAGMIPLTTDIITYKLLPAEYELTQNYPNPFNPTTEISFVLPVTSPVSLKVYNALGQQVDVLVEETLGAGQHIVTWDALDYASGVYFYRLEAGDFVQTRKMILLK
jgi:hypothetical protein